MCRQFRRKDQQINPQKTITMCEQFRKKDQQINPQKTITMCGQFRIKRKGQLFEHIPQK